MAIWQGALLGPAHVSVSQPLCVCVDSYEAEAEASVIAVVRAFEFVQALRAKGLAIQRVHFQGDNLAVVAYLQGTVVFATRPCCALPGPLGTH